MYAFVHWQMTSLVFALDPIASEKLSKLKHFSKSTKWDNTFLFPLLFFTGSALYGNVYFVLEQHLKTENHLNLSTFLSFFKNCPQSLTHQAFPRLLWAQADVAWELGSLIAVLVMATFLRAAPLSVQFDQYELVEQENAKHCTGKFKNCNLKNLSDDQQTTKMLKVGGKGAFQMFSKIKILTFLLSRTFHFRFLSHFDLSQQSSPTVCRFCASFLHHKHGLYKRTRFLGARPRLSGKNHQKPYFLDNHISATFPFSSIRYFEFAKS